MKWEACVCSTEEEEDTRLKDKALAWDHMTTGGRARGALLPSDFCLMDRTAQGKMHSHLCAVWAEIISHSK